MIYSVCGRLKTEKRMDNCSPVKNLPHVNIRDKSDHKYGALSGNDFEGCRAVQHFDEANKAVGAFQGLHQNVFRGQVQSTEPFGEHVSNAKKVSDKLNHQIRDFVKVSYPTSPQYSFVQPPPPYLKYNYPPINRAILDSISIALLTNSAFYQQVLHLMNRMNLDPPFISVFKPFIPPGETCHVQTQTDFHLVEGKSGTCTLIRSDESEMESEEECFKIKPKVKRKCDKPLLRNKMRKLITTACVKAITSRKEQNLEDVFETSTKYTNKTIALKLNTKQLSDDGDSLRKLTKPIGLVNQSSPLQLIASNNDICSKRISEDQRANLSVFKNYQRGVKSNKLYIKNLAKTVDVEDLQNIYVKYVTRKDDISIQLMLFGKMKGQAFVTFTALQENYDIVEKALNETNGFILKNKPMVVCFAKNSS